MSEVTTKRGIVVAVVICLVVLGTVGWMIGSAGRSSPYGGFSRYGEEGLRVSGTATVRAAPDFATVNLGRESIARTAREAKQANDRVMQAVIAAVKRQGVADKDVQTTDYRLYPVQVQIGPQVWVRRWRVDNMVEMRVRNVDKVADVIDAAVTAGANKVEGVQYSVEDIHKLRAQAREKAVGVARDKAEQLSRLMGVRIGRVVSIVDGGFQPWESWNRYKSMYRQANIQDEYTIAEPAVESEISKGQIVLEAREDVVFALE